MSRHKAFVTSLRFFFNSHSSTESFQITGCRRVLVTGAAGFIGSALCQGLKTAGHYVVGADIQPLTSPSICDEFFNVDLRDLRVCMEACSSCEVVFHLAADMGGMGFIGNTDNDFAIMTSNSKMTNNVAVAAKAHGVKTLVYASTACVYPKHLQQETECHPLKEQDAYPADPADAYGREKLFGEQLLETLFPHEGLRIARLHNVYGPGGTWVGGREKAPAALCRKVAAATEAIEVWGDGAQTRTFLYVDDCVEALIKLADLPTDSVVTVNIGSNELVTIDQLASLICELSGNQNLAISHISGPEGVRGRNCNFDKAQSLLNWKPKVDLRSGITRTFAWVSCQVESYLENVPLAERAPARKLLASSTVWESSSSYETPSFAVLLPVTSRGSTEAQCWLRLQRFIDCLTRTVAGDPLQATLRVFVGIDDDDKVFGKAENQQRLCEMLVSSLAVLDSNAVHFESLDQYPRGAICRYWNHLASCALDFGCTYYLLLGDDVELLSRFWMRDIHAQFVDISRKMKVPLGFGCVAFTDEAFLGFPTFPVVSKVHLSIFDGSLLPDAFENQDGDPFLFQLYRRWGCSKMLTGARLVNTIGGETDARYAKKSCNWTHSVLATAVNTVQRSLETTCKAANVLRKPVIDVVVPTFRCQLEYLRPILNLPRPEGFEFGFIVIVDQPENDTARALLKEYGRDPTVRIRCLGSNQGAPTARNRGVDESSADFIVFLDDDIKPHDGILIAYANAILEHPNADGFAGPTFLPQTDSFWCNAAVLAGVTYFWSLPNSPSFKRVPWAVTANVMLRRVPGAKFDLAFPKTGGGEDIDFCIKASGGSLVSVPAASATHPWWNNGRPPLSRFYGWAYGDGYLIHMYPQYSYTTIPNLVETLLVSVPTLMGLRFLLYSNMPLKALQPIASYSGIAKFVLALVLGDLTFELFLHNVSRPNEAAHVRGLQRVAASVWACMVRNATELGRLRGHLDRGHVQHVFRRFEWFLGMHAGARADELKMALMRSFFWTATVGMVFAVPAISSLKLEYPHALLSQASSVCGVAVKAVVNSLASISSILIK